jgi:hypothetical protein
MTITTVQVVTNFLKEAQSVFYQETFTVNHVMKPTKPCKTKNKPTTKTNGNL